MLSNGRYHYSYGSRASPPFYDQFGLRTLLAFFSNRVVHRGPKLLLHLALCLLSLIVLTRYLPQRVSDVAFGTTYSNIWHWPGSTHADVADVAEDDGSVGGGLRIVVFGENDIATPLKADPRARGQGQGWTEALCAELKCSTFLSFAPVLEPPHRSLESNTLYATEVERMLSLTVEDGKPGYNYSYLADDYPARRDLPDLKDQVSAFLSLKAPMRPPKETLWIFSFGTWDVWHLSALPIEIAMSIIDCMVGDVFDNVERLYKASFNSSSVAFSDYYSRMPMRPSEQPRTITARDGWFPSGWGDAPVEPFRILMPLLLDPSMIPGWQSDRPLLPEVHSKAEQMRNAATLTDRWNFGIRNSMETWVKKSNPVEVPKPKNPAEEHRRPPNISDKKRRGLSRMRRGATSTTPTTASASASTSASITASSSPSNSTMYPVRDGITYDMPDYLLDVIVDRQMREIGIKDQNGYGEMPSRMGFRVVATPCVMAPSAVPSVDFELGTDAMTQIRGNEELPQHGEGSSPPSPTTTSSATLEQERTANGPETTTVCESPQEHLFYTAFTLSQRAIDEIAKQSAHLVRQNVSIRAHWDGQGKPAKSGRGPGPGYWRQGLEDRP